jgi:hypothetical protein
MKWPAAWLWLARDYWISLSWLRLTVEMADGARLPNALKSNGNNGNSGAAGPLDCIQAPDEWLRFQKIDQEPPPKIGRYKNPEQRSIGVWTFRDELQNEPKNDEESDLVRLRGMPGNAVSKLHTPGKTRRFSVGIIRKPG